MIEIRKLVAVDMAAWGTRLIVGEYAVGILLPLVLAAFLPRAGGGWQTVMTIWLIGIAANYVPMFLYAVQIARAGTVKAEGQPELPHIKRYSVQQVMLLVPLMVVIV